MARTVFILLLLFSFILVMSSVAMAQDDDDDNDTTGDDDSADDDSADDDDFYSSELYFESPSALEPSETYEFMFTVVNHAIAPDDKGIVKGDWINQVDLTMPSTDYLVDESQLTAPIPLYGDTGDETEIEKWEVSFDHNTTTITWQAFGVVTSVNYGDIREGDFLSFQFVATTDAEPTGTWESETPFLWVLYSDEGNTVAGEAYIGEQIDDDDDDNDADKGDDDDDSGGGCGC